MGAEGRDCRVSALPGGRSVIQERAGAADSSGMNSVSQGATDSGAHAAQECAAIAADLDRLRALLGEAGGQLAASFAVLGEPAAGPAERQAALAKAVGALQFEDIALQLVTHAQRRLALLEDCVLALAPDAAPVKHAKGAVLPHPVGQTGMAAGEVELF